LLERDVYDQPVVGHVLEIEAVDDGTRVTIVPVAETAAIGVAGEGGDFYPL
jgi:hypothetical protein